MLQSSSNPLKTHIIAYFPTKTRVSSRWHPGHNDVILM